MKPDHPIPVVDIFAGAGGLGEGFEAYRGGGRFHVALSAEMDRHAVQTLRTRAFFRSFPSGEAPASYYDYVQGARAAPWCGKTEHLWKAADQRVCQVELGRPDHDRYLDQRIEHVARQAARQGQPWVLVGGPPCQAFSLVGRARNRGIAGYLPETDGRHFLYQHYLHILARHRPAAFVLENVKGILSSRVGGAHIFREIFEQLERPGGADGPRYRIEPIVQRPNHAWQPSDFIVRSELLGMPQKRHRVILLGVLEDVGKSLVPLEEGLPDVALRDVVAALPKVRSSLTGDIISSWRDFSVRSLDECVSIAEKVDSGTAACLRESAAAAWTGGELTTGARWLPCAKATNLPAHLRQLMEDPRMDGILQHETRAHMASDLLRYAYVSAFAAAHDRSPRGALEFPERLYPNHKNWSASNHFIDRFKAQRWNAPSSTITSHLAKDGHYFIHPDPSQMRSLTVREAARLQTFPDNFFFEGPGGAQRRQVGNAVPPWLGHQIAGI
ncbi:DNA cytosine methyltransferase, partial [Coralloluteibacterium stylophorae]|uniref:DNA cytosine methyltransferase n=1 Tax=Coralloluteibacterium stylophorae TaxID=1776034 RepID=UPI003606F583